MRGLRNRLSDAKGKLLRRESSKDVPDTTITPGEESLQSPGVSPEDNSLRVNEGKAENKINKSFKSSWGRKSRRGSNTLGRNSSYEESGTDEPARTTTDDEKSPTNEQTHQRRDPPTSAPLLSVVTSNDSVPDTRRAESPVRTTTISDVNLKVEGNGKSVCIDKSTGSGNPNLTATNHPVVAQPFNDSEQNENNLSPPRKLAPVPPSTSGLRQDNTIVAESTRPVSSSSSITAPPKRPSSSQFGRQYSETPASSLAPSQFDPVRETISDATSNPKHIATSTPENVAYETGSYQNDPTLFFNTSTAQSGPVTSAHPLASSPSGHVADLKLPASTIPEAVREESLPIVVKAHSKTPSPGASSLRYNLAQNPTSPIPAHSRRQSLSSISLKISSPSHDLETYAGADHLSSPSRGLPATPYRTGASMQVRRVWVKRPGGSPTQVSIGEDDLVDTLRDLCLRKFGNSLGRQFDSPDLTIKILPSLKQPQNRQRHHPTIDRHLMPEEILSKLLEEYYPLGQGAEDALIVDVQVAQRRTPRPSPGHMSHSYAYGTVPSVHEVHRGELDDYFTPGPHITPTLQHAQTTYGPVPSLHATNHLPQVQGSAMAAAMSIIANSPPVPASPGGSRRSAAHNRPSLRNRTLTSSPTASNASAHAIPSTGAGPGAGIMLMPRGQGRSRGNSDTLLVADTATDVVPHTDVPGEAEEAQKEDDNLPSRAPSPRPTRKAKPKEKVPTPAGPLDGQVPAINVLIVEDNIINLKLLEAFMKRLKVRWQTAMNGKEAVTKWRTGGFHLVLMDIQLPIMNGLDATKEIRRLERINQIGSFSSSPTNPDETLAEEDKLDTSVVFKSSVIIVALTASSLQSDRHEALAAGCNDFLTKPVNFIFLERKVTEWGCMQALIDFEGWHKWKDLSNQQKKTIKKPTAGRFGNKLSLADKALKEKGKGLLESEGNTAIATIG